MYISTQKNYGGLIVPTLVFLLFISGQFKWLFDLVNGVFLFIFIAPIIGVLGVRFWYNLNVVEGKCPNCGAQVRLDSCFLFMYGSL